MKHWITNEFFIVLIAATVLGAVVAIVCGVGSNARAQTPTPTPPTEQEICDQVIADLNAWAKVVHRPRDWNQAHRRDACAVSIEFMATSCSYDDAFTAQKDAACAVLKTYFPDWPCQACEN